MTEHIKCPRISVLMPSLNVVSYIRQSLESVLTQSLKDIEIICIDAGSTDGTLEVIEEYEKADSRIRVIHSEVKSYGRQMNLGIEAATGEYIGIVETDDYVEPDMFATLYDLAHGTGSDVAKGTYRLVFEDETGNQCGWTSDFIPEYIREGHAFDPELSPDIHSWDRFIWNGIYRRHFLKDKNIRFSETRGAAFQDISFQQIVLNEAERIVFTRKPLYCYRSVRPGASTLSSDGIRFLYSEYNRIFEYEGLKKERIAAIQSRMLWAFVYEYEKALLLANYDKPGMKYNEETEWFFDKIKEIYENSLFSRNYLSDHYEGKVKRLLFNEETFLNNAKKGRNLLGEWINRLVKLREDRQVIVYGCGNYGLAVVPGLVRNSIIPDAVIDQDKRRHGEDFFGYRISSPEIIAKDYPDALYVVAARDTESMKADLRELGIKADHIYECAPGIYTAMKLIPYPLVET